MIFIEPQRPLTPRQREVLVFIDTFYAREGFPPSVREIGASLGMLSTSTVQAHIVRLVYLGYLVRLPGKRGVIVNRAA